MSNIQAEDDFIYGNPSTTSARQASWENQLLDDYDQEYAPGQRVCIDDTTMMDWDRVAEERRELRDWHLKYDRDDKVNSPTHYNSGGIECIDAIKASMTAEEFKGYLKGNTEKYIWRYAYKNGLEDLKKAKVYLQWLIDNVEKDDAL